MGNYLQILFFLKPFYISQFILFFLVFVFVFDFDKKKRWKKTYDYDPQSVNKYLVVIHNTDSTVLS